jgi:presenilin-like A22 family membrane protease
MRYVLTGRPQAGLPLLNGGTLLGFGISYLLVFQNLNFGII